MITLGDKVKDKITGLEGIAIAEIKYLNGCHQFEVQAKANKDGSVPDPKWIDSIQLDVTQAKAANKATKPKHGGVRNHPK